MLRIRPTLRFGFRLRYAPLKMTTRGRYTVWGLYYSLSLAMRHADAPSPLSALQTSPHTVGSHPQGWSLMLERLCREIKWNAELFVKIYNSSIVFSSVLRYHKIIG